jgi:hypothetical protein
LVFTTLRILDENIAAKVNIQVDGEVILAKQGQRTVHCLNPKQLPEGSFLQATYYYSDKNQPDNQASKPVKPCNISLLKVVLANHP